MTNNKEKINNSGNRLNWIPNFLSLSTLAVSAAAGQNIYKSSRNAVGTLFFAHIAKKGIKKLTSISDDTILNAPKDSQLEQCVVEQFVKNDKMKK